VEIGFSGALARLRFRHRVSELPDGALAYRLDDKSGHVRVSKAEWEEAGTFFADSTSKSARKATLFVLLSLPAYVVYAIACGLIVPKELALAMPSWLYFLLFIGPLPGMPIAIYLWHSYHVRKVSRALDATLAQRPRIAAPTLPSFPTPPFWFDLICLLFIGPHLILAVIGELNPDLFRNTPLTGRHIDANAVFSFALLGLRIAWGEIAKRRNQTPHASR
jgi:hypothetical protein